MLTLATLLRRVKMCAGKHVSCFSVVHTVLPARQADIMANQALTVLAMASIMVNIGLRWSQAGPYGKPGLAVIIMEHDKLLL